MLNKHNNVLHSNERELNTTYIYLDSALLPALLVLAAYCCVLSVISKEIIVNDTILPLLPGLSFACIQWCHRGTSTTSRLTLPANDGGINSGGCLRDTDDHTANRIGNGLLLRGEKRSAYIFYLPLPT